jgi:uncharacterized protein YbjT (DUF2867 family)
MVVTGATGLQGGAVSRHLLKEELPLTILRLCAQYEHVRSTNHTRR